MAKILNVSASADTTVIKVNVTAAPGSAGDALSYSLMSLGATIFNTSISAGVEFKVNSGAWKYIGKNNGAEQAINFFADTLYLRKTSVDTSDASVEISISGIPTISTQENGANLPVAVASTTIRQIANGTKIYNTLASAGFNFCAGKYPHLMKDSAPSFQLVFSNIGVLSQIETNGPADRIMKCSVEYPAGVYTPVLFNGIQQISISPGTEVISDPIQMTIPEGARFWTRVKDSCSGGVLYDSFYGSDGTSRFVANTSDVPDYVNGGGEWTTQGPFQGKYSGPVAIIGVSGKPVVASVGDSIFAGQRDTGDTSLNTGIFHRLFPRYASLNLSVPGTRLTQFISSHNYRNSLISRYATHVGSNLGINDLAAGARTAAQVLADMNTVIGYYPDKVFALGTLLPFTTSTDGYITTANQTLPAFEAARIVVNAQRRNGLPGVAAVLDFARAAESSLGSGLWQVEPGTVSPGTPNWVTDGTHPDKTGVIGICNKTENNHFIS